MRRFVIMLVLAGSVLLHQASAMTRVEGQRVVELATVCLPDVKDRKTRAYVLEALARAAERPTDLIVLPFMPFLSFNEATEAADLADFAALARGHSTHLAMAMVEKAGGGKTYHSALLIGREGNVLGKYRKTHALPDEDGISLGGELPVFKTELGMVGLSITTDFYFPEAYNVLRLKGAEILVWHHTPERFRDPFQWVPLLKARCLDSHAHMITAMYADPRTLLANRYEIGMQGAAWGRSMILNRVGVAVADTGYDDGIARATVNLDKRKINVHSPFYQKENIFFCNCQGDRKAFKPIAEPWTPPKLPAFKKRKARIAVGYFDGKDIWRDNVIPKVMLDVIDQAAPLKPDLLLLSEMAAVVENEVGEQAMAMVADRARKMGCYIVIGGLRKKDRVSQGIVWDRTGKVVFSESIYWTKGFDEIKVHDTDFARIGIHLCGDLYTHEVDRVLALKGAEIILDPSQHWGADGCNNELMLRARAVDNGCWVACAHWNSSDTGLRSLVVDPYGYVMVASHFQKNGVVYVDVDFDEKKVYYAGKAAHSPKPGKTGIPSYFTGDLPEQRRGWREMIFSRRRPELYGVIPAENEVTRTYRPSANPFEKSE
ncbi:MAG: carbon-nitrogen hydrolase family protein [Phycisphaerae bacterium]|nr:carbon-nitrogen hydrolase family protein [Phycisphaerae bacterium]